MEKNVKEYDVIVIGGGASGIISAIFASRCGAKVLLLEKNTQLGNKLSISGGGRCNIWNEEYDKRLLLSNYGLASKYLHSAFSRFGLSETIEFFHSIGITQKVEARKRAFPISEKAQDVVSALKNELKRLKVDVKLESKVKKINLKDHRITSVVTELQEYTANNYILSTGGYSHPETGSTGDGFTWLQSIGHTIHKPLPTITPLSVRERWLKKLLGTKLEDIRLTFKSKSKKPIRIEGSILLTHFGISGPAVLNSSTKVADLLEESDVSAHLDLLPKLNSKQTDELLLNTIQNNSSKQLANGLRGSITSGSIKTVRAFLGEKVDFNQKMSELSKRDRELIGRSLKNITFTIDKLMGFDRAVVADGGLDINEIDTKTMRSNKVDNLYITGDLLDITRPSGGYSLQLCWTSGAIAGICAIN